MSRNIEMAFKSTLDWIINDLAIKLSADLPSNRPVKAFDLDDSASERQVQAGAEHALVYQYTHLGGADPLYSAEFLIGAKTTADAGNYDMTTLLTELRDLFRGDCQSSFDLYDYSEVEEGQDPGEILGTLVIQDVGTGPQMFEKQSGVRLLAVTGKVMAYG